MTKHLKNMTDAELARIVTVLTKRIEHNCRRLDAVANEMRSRHGSTKSVALPKGWAR